MLLSEISQFTTSIDAKFVFDNWRLHSSDITMETTMPLVQIVVAIGNLAQSLSKIAVQDMKGELCTHTHTLSLSLIHAHSLSLSYTHTHTHTKTRGDGPIVAKVCPQSCGDTSCDKHTLSDLQRLEQDTQRLPSKKNAVILTTILAVQQVVFK